ncbi:hypothetical protein HPB52_004738 [Rhipicephalus sanguineus]|uniref:Uncharacterized protein n=1 Tax=Rhipicephalus sanguineus TaxID=34632 RepID=A0A9D4PQB0_RHISA|nr:hypothetical protein HPB52_004738 [Rhipicephalus sanguineus]
MLSPRQGHVPVMPLCHTTQCVLPFMPRCMTCPNQEHQSYQLTNYIVAVVSRMPPPNHLQWCPRGTGTRCLVEGPRVLLLRLPWTCGSILRSKTSRTKAPL